MRSYDITELVSFNEQSDSSVSVGPLSAPMPITDAELQQIIGFVGTSNGNAYQRHMHYLTLLALQELQLRRVHQP